MSLAGVAQETLRIIKQGEYVAPSGRTVSLREPVERAVQGTVLYRPADFERLESPPSPGGALRVEVTPEKTGEASAPHRGGGRGGRARAQLRLRAEPGWGFRARGEGAGGGPTAPAPNAGAALQKDPSLRPGIREVLHSRALKVLQVAAHRRHRTLVLGAWGCGAFRNDPVEAAGAFAAALSALPGAFERVVFAVYERGGDGPNLSAFRERFGQRAS